MGHAGAPFIDKTVINALGRLVKFPASFSIQLWGLRMRATTRLATYSMLCLLLTTGTSHAYLDPGTGSILLQGLIAGVAGGLVVIRLYWARAKSFFSFNKKKDDEIDKQLTH